MLMPFQITGRGDEEEACAAYGECNSCSGEAKAPTDAESSVDAVVIVDETEKPKDEVMWSDDQKQY